MLPSLPACDSKSGRLRIQASQNDLCAVDMDCGAWADQSCILCSFGTGIFSVRASDGGDPVRLTTNPYAEGGGNDLASDISPSGTEFLFLRSKPGASPGPKPFQTQQVALFVENLDGTGLRQITPYGLAAPHEI